MPPVVALNRITKAYENKIAVNDLSLQIDSGTELVQEPFGLVVLLKQRLKC